MNFYGFTVVNTATEITDTDMNGNQCFRESAVKIFPSRKEAIKAAKEHLEEEFDAYEEYLPEGQDENGKTLKELLSYLEQGEDICIQFPDFHILIEFFQKDMGREIINLNDYLATIIWSVDDITAELAERGYPFDERAVRAVVDHGIKDGSWKALEECLDSDWEIINKVIDETVMLHPEIFGKEEELEYE